MLNGRYEIIAHLDDIGSRDNKNWFLLSDSTVRHSRTKSSCNQTKGTNTQTLKTSCYFLKPLEKYRCAKAPISHNMAAIMNH